MKLKKALKYVAVTILMGGIGFGIGAGLGALSDLVFYYLGGQPLTWMWTAILGTIMMMAFALSVYAPNPIAVLLDKYMQIEEEYKKTHSIGGN